MIHTMRASNFRCHIYNFCSRDLSDDVIGNRNQDIEWIGSDIGGDIICRISKPEFKHLYKSALKGLHG